MAGSFEPSAFEPTAFDVGNSVLTPDEDFWISGVAPTSLVYLRPRFVDLDFAAPGVVSDDDIWTLRASPMVLWSKPAFASESDTPTLSLANRSGLGTLIDDYTGVAKVAPKPRKK